MILIVVKAIISAYVELESFVRHVPNYLCGAIVAATGRSDSRGDYRPVYKPYYSVQVTSV